MQLTENFGLLAEHDFGLMNLTSLAEGYFRDDRPRQPRRDLALGARSRSVEPLLETKRVGGL
jgi:hypothetical protein